MGVLSAETSEYATSKVRSAIAVGIFDERQMRFIRNVHAAVSEFKGERNVQIVGEYARFVGAPVVVRVFQYDELVVGFVAGIYMRVSR